MNRPKISMIAAIASGNRALGKGNKLIYYIPKDLERFKKITTGHPIIMGRKTFESIGHPLPNRTNIIITRDMKYLVEDAIVVHSLDEAFGVAQEKETDEIFIIGGGQIYKEAIHLADKLYLTIIEDNPDADIFFPDYSEFRKTSESNWQEYEGIRYKFLEFER